jgi:hypothetical protein
MSCTFAMNHTYNNNGVGTGSFRTALASLKSKKLRFEKRHTTCRLIVTVSEQSNFLKGNLFITQTNLLKDTAEMSILI